MEWLASLVVMLGVLLLGRGDGAWSLLIGAFLVTIGVRYAIEAARRGDPR